MSKENIFPDRDQFVSRREKENVIKQKGLVIWFTGLSGSGKSTLATGLEKRLNSEGFLTEVLDGDKVRNGLNNNLGFSSDDRIENIRRIAEVSKLFCNCGVVTISAFISPTVEIRQMAREIIENKDFFEVYVSTPIEVCEQRDIKGLYKKAREGVIKDFTGVSAPYEAPLKPNIDMNTAGKTVEECVEEIYAEVIKKVSF
ncbi:MAG: adenylyl-sulfate kinase [Bacteroidales bacterium]|nr:adenylyl-sulfate kinase [Bacteroidales bacterium]MBN2820570.1 adenylyl-sulfate kinase [Bacteroidales bacterium]